MGHLNEEFKEGQRQRRTIKDYIEVKVTVTGLEPRTT